MSSDDAGEARTVPVEGIAPGCLPAVVGLVAGLTALYTVHIHVPDTLCPRPGPGEYDPGPDPDFLTPLLTGILHLVVYSGVFVAGFWLPRLFLRRRRWAPIVAGSLLAPVLLLGVSTADLLLSVAPAHGLRFHVSLTDGIRFPGPCPPNPHW
ncbi:hypothetical protein [Kitasatospora sp. NPDC101183]|uniref:hypothetical protein n=1 Tax=Kitasatospora sp. NPDC101183 TaxID=3364100 RepID=UPI00380BE469